jgi:hypothetical protein
MGDIFLYQLDFLIPGITTSYSKFAENLIHFAYNLISFPGYKMSGRRGHYIAFDEVMDEAVKRAYEEVSKRSPQLSEDEKKEIASFVGIGAVRYSLVEVDPSKPVVFTWDRVLNFEKNSAPYIQYTHARACSIMRKAAKQPKTPAYELLTEKLEREIILAIASVLPLPLTPTNIITTGFLLFSINSIKSRAERSEKINSPVIFPIYNVRLSSETFCIWISLLLIIRVLISANNLL